MERLTLRDALMHDRLEDFIEQAERGSFGAADGARFDAIVSRVTAPQPSNQTSHSPARDGSRGT
jgi:hypothetical protein